jgi:hypothetical protein
MWRWDESLYAGSAAFYSVGRLPYPAAVADTLQRELGLEFRSPSVRVKAGPV